MCEASKDIVQNEIEWIQKRIEFSKQRFSSTDILPQFGEHKRSPWVAALPKWEQQNRRVGSQMKDHPCFVEVSRSDAPQDEEG